MAQKYVKRPIPVEAVQWDGSNEEEIIEFCGDNAIFDDYKLYIQTLEGEMKARQGDFIIKGIRGEFYPCAYNIFLESYEVYDDEGNKMP